MLLVKIKFEKFLLIFSFIFSIVIFEKLKPFRLLILLAVLFVNNVGAAVFGTTIGGDISNNVGFLCNGADGMCEITDLAGIFQFDFDLNKPSNTMDCYDSPTILLNNLNWTLKMCYSGEDVKFKLTAVPNFLSSYWACDADIRLKVLGSHSENVFHETNWNNVKYSSLLNSNTYDKFMDKNTFATEYEKDKKVKFEVEFSTTPLEMRPPRPIQEVIRTYEKIYFKLHNFSTFWETVSPETNVQGVRWRVRIEKNNNQLYAYLSADPNDFDVDSTYKVFGVFKLLSFDSSKQNIAPEFTRDFGQYITSHSVGEFLLDGSSNENQTYVQHDCANIVVEFKVHKSKQPSNLNAQLKEKSEHTQRQY